jgi:hypothetical protein
MAFAQPFLPAKEQLSSQRDIAIYLDNSFSMSAPVEEKVRALDAGVNFVREIVTLFPPETRFKLLTNDFAPFSNSFKTSTEVIDQLSQIRLSPIGRNLEEIIKRLGQSGSAVFWVSDFQKSTLGNEIVIDSTWQLRLVPIQYNALSNVFVDSVYLENPFVIGGEKNSVRVRMRNQGTRALEGLVTKLTINGVQVATSSVVLQPNSSVETSFDLSGNLKGSNEAVFSFSDFPVSFDNEFYFTLNYSGRLRVIEIRAEGIQDYIEKVFGNQQLFDFKSYSVKNIDYSLMDNADVVLVNGLNKIEPSLNAALQSYRDNGSLILIPGLQPNVDDYKSLLGISQLTRIEKTTMDDLDKPDFQNPFFENVFEEKTASIAMPKATRQLNWGADRSAILRFRNGEPYLSRFGNTFILSAALDKSTTDFYNHALFVPVMYRMASSGKKTESKPYFYLTTSLVTVSADSLAGEEPVKLIGPQELVPAQRRTGNRLLMELPRFSVERGFYRVLHKRDTLELLAFNLDKRESMLEQFSGEEIKTMLGGGNHISIFKANSTQTFSNEIKERYLGTPLWKYALILALTFLLAEVLLIRFLK